MMTRRTIFRRAPGHKYNPLESLEFQARRNVLFIPDPPGFSEETYSASPIAAVIHYPGQGRGMKAVRHPSAIVTGAAQAGLTASRIGSGRRQKLFANCYLLHAQIGEGGMGKVFAATHAFCDAEVAIKCIPRSPATEDLAARAQEDAAVLSSLVHPNIVRQYDAGVTDDGVIYIVMERVDGEPLRKLITTASKRETRLDVRLVLHVMALVAEAMHFAHAKGITHRDLRPENILVTQGGHACVLGFGIARHEPWAREPRARIARTSLERAVVTLRDIAAEKAREHKVDARADIAAIGVALYESLSGQRPYATPSAESTTVAELMGHQARAEPRPLRELVPECPERVWLIVRRCLAKDPAQRFATMGELARALRAALREHLEAAARAERRREGDGFARGEALSLPPKMAELYARFSAPPAATPAQKPARTAWLRYRALPLAGLVLATAITIVVKTVRSPRATASAHGAAQATPARAPGDRRSDHSNGAARASASAPDSAARDLDGHHRHLGACARDLGACARDLGTRRRELGACARDLGTRRRELDACARDLGHRRRGAVANDLGACASGRHGKATVHAGGGSAPEGPDAGAIEASPELFCPDLHAARRGRSRSVGSKAMSRDSEVDPLEIHAVHRGIDGAL